MNVAVGTGLAFAAVMAICLFILWFGSAVIIDQLEDRIEVLERNWAEQFGAPVVDDSPEAMAEEDATYKSVDEIYRSEPDDCPTDEIPIAPPTVPDGMPLAVQTALIERPSPVPRKSADWVEDAIKGFNFSGRDR